MIPRQVPVSRPGSPAPSRPRSPLGDSAPDFADTQMPDLDLGNLGLQTDTSMEGNVAPDIEMPHEQPEEQAPTIVESLGAGQTGAEGEATRVSAESEQEQIRQHDPSLLKQQAPRPAAPPQQPSPKAISGAMPKQAAKVQQKQMTVPQQSPRKAMPTDTTVLSESLSQFKTSFLDFKHGLMDVLQRYSRQKKGASASASLTITPKPSARRGSAAAPNLDRMVGLHVSTAAEHAEVMMPSEEDSFISKRTESGNSYGSLEPYFNTWNASDLAEVSSNPKPHPAGPSALARRMYEVDAAAVQLSRTVHAAHETAKVKIVTAQLLTRQNICPSPVPEIRVEYAVFIVNL